MTHETDPDQPAVSERKRAANRSNAQKSTGPRTEAGKAQSRRNALKHGLCAVVIAVPDEDPALFDARLELWDRELNPAGLDSSRYLVTMAVRHSVQLDRCDLAHTARIADLARNADAAHREARSKEVEELARMLKDDNDIAVRRLKSFPEGCEYLAKQWRLLEPTLVDPAHWDKQDESEALKLLGDVRPYKAQASSPLALDTLAIDDHRALARRLRLNERAQVDWMAKYKDEDERQFDYERLPMLADRSERAVAGLKALIDAQVAGLLGRRDLLIEQEGPSRSEATYRARFDASDAGKLLHRYEGDHERGFLGVMKALRVARTETLKSTQLNCKNSVEEIDRAEPRATNASHASRNEPTAASPTDPSRPAPGPKTGVRGAARGVRSKRRRSKDQR